ncbi:beta-N-acetylhexosaminidase [Paenibacillus favisporus]|uniref:Beta-N-acetylhexosaminidase n=1 Tax=Paenibacillus favisporus TaxID=221028 RepID=A0ABV2EWF0_9BACL
MLVSDLTLEQKIGQMFICGFHAQEPDEQIRRLIEEYHVGGVIYFRRNIGEPEQVAAMSSSLQEMAAKQGKLPLWIAIDQEGGMVARIDHRRVSRIPGNMSLGATGNPDFTYRVSAISAQELHALGINMNFAPVLDVNNNPRNPVIGVRSFGEDPEQVAEHGSAAIRAYQEHGVSVAAKHFPGHGDTSVDSHLGLASVEHGMERLREVELKPFVRAIRDGVDVIMTAHVVFPAIEKEAVPATLSKAVLTGLLRDQLGYEGVIVTDCLEMHAIAKHFGVGEGAVLAVEAGADIVLVSHTLQDQIEAVEAVMAAVRSGRIPESVIDAAVSRVLKLKEKRLQPSGTQDSAPAFLERHEKPETERLLREVAASSITLVKDDGQLPLQEDEPVLVVWPELRSETQVDEPWTEAKTLGQALSEYIQDVNELTISAEPDLHEVEQVLAAAKGYRQVVVATYTAGSELPAGQRRLVEGLIALQPQRLVVASTRNPYDLAAVPASPAYLCCYENTPYFMEGLASILTGHAKAGGTLPVSLGSQTTAS